MRLPIWLKLIELWPNPSLVNLAATRLFRSHVQRQPRDSAVEQSVKGCVELVRSDSVALTARPPSLEQLPRSRTAGF